MQLYQIILIILAGLLVSLSMLYIVTGKIMLKITLTPDKDRDKEHNPAISPDKTHTQRYEQEWLAKAPHEDVYINSKDKLKLHGHLYINTQKSHKYVVACHGYNGYWKELSIPCKHYYEDLGFNVLFIDQRAQGESEGKYMTMGYKEKFDVVAWCNFIVKKDPDSKILLLGHSMGAATVMMVSGMSTMPSNVKCIIEDCGYPSIKEQILDTLDKMKVPTKLMYSAGSVVARLFYGISFTKDSPRDALKKTKVPFLFIHGGSDTFVPSKFLQINYDSLTNKAIYKDKLVVPAACHGMSFIYDEKAYIEKSESYIKKFIK